MLFDINLIRRYFDSDGWLQVKAANAMKMPTKKALMQYTVIVVANSIIMSVRRYFLNLQEYIGFAKIAKIKIKC